MKSKIPAITLMLLAILAIIIFVCLTACNTHKHLTTASLSVDTSKTVNSITHASIDSSSSRNSASNVDYTDSSVTISTDDYELTKTTTYQHDTTGKTYKVATVTKIKGTRKTAENKNQKLKANTIDTTKESTHSEIKENKNITQAGAFNLRKTDLEKTSESAFKVPAWLWIIGALIILVGGVYLAYRLKNKVT